MSVDWKTLVPRLGFRYLLPEVELRYAEGAGGAQLLAVTRHVLDRETGAPEEVTVTYQVPSDDDCPSEQEAVEFVLYLIQGNAGWEAKQRVTLDGELALVGDGPGPSSATNEPKSGPLN